MLSSSTSLIGLVQAKYTDKSVRNLMYALGVLVVGVILSIFLGKAFKEFKEARLKSPEEAKKAHSKVVLWAIPTGIVVFISLFLFGRGVYFSWQSRQKEFSNFNMSAVEQVATENKKESELKKIPEFQEFQSQRQKYQELQQSYTDMDN